MEQGNLTKAHCNTCSGERDHFILYEDKKEWSEQLADDPAAYIYGEDKYELLKCAGCGRVTFRHTSVFSENTDEDGRIVPTVTYYPPATFRREPKWLSGTDLSTSGNIAVVRPPEFVSRLLKEIYVGLHGDCRSLAVMGVRALLERIMIDRVTDQGSFAQNLQAFQDQGFIGSLQKDTLEVTLEVGHASMHRNYNPSRSDLEHVLDIAENIVEAIYVNHQQAAELRKRIPPRPKRT